jgi:hypothetical protein
MIALRHLSPKRDENADVAVGQTIVVCRLPGEQLSPAAALRAAGR